MINRIDFFFTSSKQSYTIFGNFVEKKLFITEKKMPEQL